MKNTFLFILILLLIVSIAACNNGNNSVNPPDAVVNTTETGGTVPETSEPMVHNSEDTGNSSTLSEDDLSTVEVTLPSSYFEDFDTSTFDADVYASEKGYISAVLNNDGSVTVKMTKAKHKELLELLSISIEEAFTGMIDSTPYILDIKYTDNYETITAKVDKDGYESSGFDLKPFMLGMGMMYQNIKKIDYHVEAIIEDVVTGEVLSTEVYPDNMSQNEMG